MTSYKIKKTVDYRITLKSHTKSKYMKKINFNTILKLLMY